MTKKAWLIFIVLCVAVVGGLIWLSRGAQVNVDDIDHAKAQDASDKNGQIGDHIIGPKDAKVTIIEYGDYQCPGCGQAAPVLKAVQERHPEHVAFIFRNFPLVSAHPNARAASAAAEAAGLQSKYGPMHDKLFANQAAWSTQNSTERTETFKNYAREIGLDVDKFVADLTADNVAKKIDFDVALARKVNVTGTPTIYVNGKLADQNVKDGKLVAPRTPESGAAWNSVDDFDKLIVIPALRDAGVKVDEPKND